MTYIINDLKRKKIIDRWFFIRYADPKSHLRIRFHFIETKDISMAITIINDFLNKFHKRKAIEKIQIDTYEREIERYHACGIEQAEYLFWYDSEFTLKILDLINRSESHYLKTGKSTHYNHHLQLILVISFDPLYKYYIASENN